MFSVKGLGFGTIAVLMAVVSIALGVYLTFFHSAGFVRTDATIVSVEEKPDEIDHEETEYVVVVEYDVDGAHYTSELGSYSPSYKAGKTIHVLYNPDDPSVVHDGSGAMGIYCIALGVVILAIAVISGRKTKQARKELEEIKTSAGAAGFAPSVKGEEREVYFLTDMGTPKYGHRIEDRERRVLYEAKMTKFSLMTPYGFDFIDHEHGRTVPHLVGHEEEAEWDNSLLLDSNYTFTLDGEDIWKHLKRNGISVETGRMDGTVWPRYRVFRDGEEIAVIESSSQFVHEEDAKEHAVMSKVAVQGFFRIWTREETLDAVFVTALAFARSGAIDDEGGTFGKAIRSSIKKKVEGHQ